MEFKPRIYEKNIPARKLIDDLKSVARRSGSKKLSMTHYEKYGRYHRKTFSRLFGSWSKALKKAGLEPAGVHYIKDEELMKNLKEVWKKLGRQPSSMEMKSPISKYSNGPYVRVFGSWNRALEMLALYTKDWGKYRLLLTARSKRRKRRRGFGFKIRYEVLKRDDYTCKACGRSPATQKGLDLHLDHIKPISQGGKNEKSNLQTLCRECNQGKGDAVV